MMRERSLQVLVVDDDEDDYVLTRDLMSNLNHGGVDLRWARDRQAMHARLATESFDLLLLDQHLGADTGLELLAELKRERPSLPVILLTGHGNPDLDHEAMTRGAVDYLDKHELTSTLLERTMRHAVERAQLQQRERESNERYRLLIEHARDGVAAADANGRVTFANPAFCDMVGYSLDEIIGRPAIEFVHPEDRPLVGERATRRYGGEIAPDRYEHRVLTRDGQVRHVEVQVAALVEHGKVTGMQATLRDITDRKQAEEALRESEARYRSLIHHFPQGAILLFDHDLRFLVANGRALETIGLPGETIIGKTLHEAASPAGAARLEPAYRAALAGQAQQFELSAREREFLVSVVPVHDDQQAIIAGMVMAIDITERKILEREISHQAFHDALTGLPNRSLLFDRLDRALVHAQRHGGSVAILFLDLDDFKVVNDSLGHAVGDLLLVEVAKRLERCVRGDDTIARFGGDEFVVVSELGDGATAVEIAERILASFRSPIVIGDRELFVACSIGIALSQAGMVSRSDLLRHADIALYRVKAGGKHSFEIFDHAMHEAAIHRLELERDLRGAVERGEFRLVYQPIIELASGTQLAFEALLRWEHPVRGLVSPSEFVPIAESTGLIIEIGDWVISEACRQLAAWRAAGCPAGLCMSVNIAARQFLRPDLVDHISASLQAAGLAAEQLIVELTETDVMADPESAAQRLSRLKELGVAIAIDDFGTGYSSLAYLHDFPVDVLKIDRSFVARMGGDPDGTPIVSATIALAHTLGIQVVAEGIETLPVLTTLRNLGCDRGQGYYFSKPLPPEQVVWQAGRLVE
jgi:diguanylate cyclase (GGDEF)-like protein/PAS domain S-box-containing protein